MLKLTVSQDGSGDFAAISEAVLAVPYELEARSASGPASTGKSWSVKNGRSPCGARGGLPPPCSLGTAASCPTRMGGPPTPSAATPLFSAAERCGGGSDH